MQSSHRQTTEDRLPGTHLVAVPLCPEILLHLKPAGCSLDAFRAAGDQAFGAGTPYWAVAWPGGQALARYILDRPGLVAGRHVSDLGTGSGLVAIAAARSGAASVRALDRDPHAIRAARLNASANRVSVSLEQAELDAETVGECDLVLAGDLWYERFDALRVTGLLRALADRGAHVLAGDPGWGHFPRRDVERLASFEAPLDIATGAGETRATRVWRILPHTPTA